MMAPFKYKLFSHSSPRPPTAREESKDLVDESKDLGMDQEERENIVCTLGPPY